jgi:hypothetical protein
MVEILRRYALQDDGVGFMSSARQTQSENGERVAFKKLRAQLQRRELGTC